MRGDERAAVSAMVTATETAALHEAVRADAAEVAAADADADADRTALAVVFHARRRLGLEAADATVSGLFGVGSAPARSGADPSQLSSGPDTAEALADVGYSAEAGWESLAAGATSEGAGAGASVGVARSTEIRPVIGEVRSAGAAPIAREGGEDPIDAVSQLAMSASAAPPGETPAARGGYLATPASAATGALAESVGGARGAKVTFPGLEETEPTRESEQAPAPREELEEEGRDDDGDDGDDDDDDDD